MAITTRNSIFSNIATGKEYRNVFLGIGPGSSITAGAAASGFWSGGLFFNSIGTTLPGTLVGFPTLNTPPNETFNVLAEAINQSSNQKGLFLVRLYTLGTLDLTATGDKFTPDAATFPVLRTQFGVASQPVSLIPIVYITTATTLTAAVFRLRKVDGSAGYTDQDANSTVGTKTMTLPNVTTTVNSVYVIRLEEGDSGIQTLTNIEVTTASTATGAATIFGVELLCPLSIITSSITSTCDSVFSGLAMTDINPAVATSGTATSYLALMSLGTSGSISGATPILYMSTVVNS